ncbi:hypothetical protein BO221_45405 [Archangium sp. Cb G35]|uniref:hypothetical protein n=1 Tax=Archangium sp. Cb G35 TaxID=1920190 RepID=UPI0009360245|nr:hypothetical protein [Archangium sp. Cb G35]OJT17359.1 hypothetical protein BO221_45405 [Archangium sp. Cb G35]
MNSQARLVRALACAAITPGLRTILVFDATPERLDAMARLLGRMLEAVTGQAPVRASLPATDDEDALWGHHGLAHGPEGARLVWRPGPFEPAPDEHAPRLVVIPDLTRLGLAAVRAGVALAGADVAQLERHGQSRHWRPELCWLAACARKDLGKLSPHLLDRFVLRLDAAGLQPAEPLEAIEHALQGAPGGHELAPEESARYLSGDRLARAVRHQPRLDSRALRRVLAYFSTKGGPPRGARRELALARLAEALARLDAAEEVLPAHVDAAAELVGLLSPEARAERERTPVPPPPAAPEPKTHSEGKATSARPVTPPRTWEAPGEAPEPDATIHPPGEARIAPAGPMTATPAPGSREPYPEDAAPVERAPESLRPLPRRRTAGIGSRRGTIIGVTQAQNLSDLALSATLLEAMKYQALRRKHHPERRGLLLSASDLRAHVRAAPPDSLLVLVVDHTALRDWDWGTAVLPFLKRAYVQRAAVCVVQVGAADAENELCAHRVMSRNALAPQLYRALAAGPGKATPLAHGLELALETLRHALRHGRGTVTRARLVLVTDGRGNVPLEASRFRERPPLVRDEGVKDALQVAERLRELERVESVLIHSRPRFYPELPSSLAEALGARQLAPRKEKDA